ncbi:MAG TPA: DnaJ domain-containing protein [Gammaproteobacteria bacterium]|nr:DnaJ domain-containing protein [Gammaproteobacteria bacterium]
MSSNRDYYRILHVQPDAPTEIIHSSYRTLMQRLRNHPDLGGDHEHAVLLNEAHAVLSDPDQRAAYDLQRDIEAAQGAAKPDLDETPTVDQTGELFAALCCIFCGVPHGLDRAIDVEDECSHCSSPLLPAERRRLASSGQRTLSRMPKKRSVTFYTSWPQAEPFAAEMRDVSLRGMQIQTTLRLKTQQIIKIDCAICQTLARIVHCHRDPQSSEHWLVGVEFLTLRFATKRGSFISVRA